MKNISLKPFRLFLLLAILLPNFAATFAYAGELCGKQFADIAEKYPQANLIAHALEDFATENKLPVKVMEFGPDDRKIKRLVVMVDGDDPAMLQKYRDRFNLNSPTQAGDEKLAGTLALEFQYEKADNYVTGVLRPSAVLADPIYRWGRKDINLEEWWKQWFTQERDSPVYGYGHLIGLNKAEQSNVKHYLEHSNVSKPDPVVAPCKSDNCVAWTSGIELGVSKVGATPEERKFLFSELGMGRSSAHFEIGRRLANAANERHSAMVVFYRGKKNGLAKFEEDPKKFLPTDPQIPYESVIKNYGFADDSEVMKAVSQIPDGAKVFVPIAAGASGDAISALLQTVPKLKKGLDVHMLVNGVSEAVLQRGVNIAKNRFRLHGLFLGGNMRKLHSQGKVTLIPGYLSDFTRAMKSPDHPQFHYDVIIVRVAPADANGRYSLGPNNDMIMTVLRERPGIKVIAEVNPNIPRTTGENFITEQQITAKFSSDTALAGPPVVPFTKIEENIGKNIASLVEDGSTLQVGIGNVFSGLPKGMKELDRKDIKISTEMFSDQMKDLIDDGVVTEAETGFAYGSGDLYKWLDQNPKVKFVETEYVNDPARIAGVKQFRAVNTALQVNLYGDVNATMGPGGVRMSSPGGQVEFMQGAHRSENGRGIIALRSTAKNDELSTITLDNYPGPVTTPHEMVANVVTEYGIASLRGKSERERAIQMINIAHPKFRQELFNQAKTRGLLNDLDQRQLRFHDQPIQKEH